MSLAVRRVALGLVLFTGGCISLTGPCEVEKTVEGSRMSCEKGGSIHILKEVKMPYPDTMDEDEQEKQKLNLARGGRDEQGKLIRKPAPPPVAAPASAPVGFIKNYTPEEKAKQAQAQIRALRKFRPGEY